MAISISLRTSQFGDAQLDSTHFNTSAYAYASFVVTSVQTDAQGTSLNLGDAAVANLNDLSHLSSTLTTTLNSDIDAIMQSLSGVLGAGATYIDSTDSWSFGSITLNSSASGTSGNWTAVIEAIDSALATAEGNISQNTTDIGLNATAIGNNTTAIGNNTTAIGNNTTAIGNNATAIGGLRSHVNSALGTTVPAFVVDATTPFIGANANSAQTETVKAYIEALAGQIQSSIVGLGSVFEYKDATSVDPQGNVSAPNTSPNATLVTRGSWTAGVEFQDLSTLTDKESGDYYKAASAGWVSYDSNGANAIFVNQGDGIVWNTSTPTPTIDKIDNTDFNVIGQGNISVTGDISVGFTVDSGLIDSNISANASAISTNTTNIGNNANAIATNATDISALQTFTGIGTALSTTATNLAGAVNELEANNNATQAELDALEIALGFPIQADGSYSGRSGTTFLKGQTTLSGELSKLDAVLVSLQAALGTGNSTGPTSVGGIEAKETVSGDPATMNFAYSPFSGTNYIDGNSSLTEDILALDSALSTLATSSGDLRTDVETILGVTPTDLDTNRTASSLNTSAQTIVPAINELHGEVDANASAISSNTSAIGVNAGNITANSTAISNNTTAITSNDADITRIVASVELNANGSKTDFNSDGQGNTFNITADGSFKAAIQELDQALQVSQVVDTARLTVAPMSHQYAQYDRLGDATDLADYASEAFGASTLNYTNPNVGGQGDLHDFVIADQFVVLGSRPSNAPNPLHAVDASHLNNQNYWYNVKVFKNGVRLFQRNPNAVLKASSDEYKLTEVVYPASYPQNYDTYERYPMVIPTKVVSTYRASQLNQAKGTIDPNAGEPHPLAGMRNLDDQGLPHPLFGQQHGDAGQPKYWVIEFGASLNPQDIIVVDYMGLKD